jgi:hypothetical protein
VEPPKGNIAYFDLANRSKTGITNYFSRRNENGRPPDISTTTATFGSQVGPSDRRGRKLRAAVVLSV